MNQTSCEISFVIVSWNAREYLRKCLSSLRTATKSLDSETLVVDNASTDGSPEMVEESFPDVRLIRNASNTGFAKANNLGIRLARGTFLCLVNSDVEVNPDTIVVLVQHMAAHADVGLLGPRVLNSDLSLQPSCRTLPSIWSSFVRALQLDSRFPRSRLFGAHPMTNWSHNEVREVEILSGCFWLIRRSALEKVGPLDERFFMYGEDMDFCKRFHRAGWKVMFQPKAQIVHHGGGSSANAPTRFWIEMQRANLQYWEKHHGCMAMRCYYVSLLLHNSIRSAGFGLLCLRRSKNQAVRRKLEKHWRALGWLLSREVILAMVRGHEVLRNSKQGCLVFETDEASSAPGKVGS